MATLAMTGWTVTELLADESRARQRATRRACQEASSRYDAIFRSFDVAVVGELERAPGDFRYFLSDPDFQIGASLLTTSTRERVTADCAGVAIPAPAKLAVYEALAGDSRFSVARVEEPHSTGGTTVLEVASEFDTLAGSQRRQQLVVLICIAALSGMAAAFGMLAYMHRRLRTLSTTLRAAADGDLARRAPGDRDITEFGLLAREVNHALTRIEAQHQALESAAHIAGHSLISPLNAANSRLVVLGSLRLTVKAREQVDGARQRLVEAEAGARALLQLALEKAGRQRRARMVEVDLSKTLNSIIEAEREHGAEALTIGHWVEAGVSIVADPDLIAVMIGELLHNARKYSSDGEAMVRLASTSGAEGAGFRLEINNRTAARGGGYAYLQRPFQRGDTASGDDGYGVGLNMMHTIATDQGLRSGYQVEGDIFKAWLSGPTVQRRSGDSE